jgi:RHH-type proline utilization regulon transcriptional repressor/proline dehydrogenase/delta 1-pyrroline-5-carboxylate dehydrogenase
MWFDEEEKEKGRGGEGETINDEPLTVPTLFFRDANQEARWLADLAALQAALQDGAAGGQRNADAETCRVLEAISSYEKWAREEFRAVHDHFRLLGEDNYRRYLPVEPLRIRIHPDDSLSDIFCRAAAARAAGCRATISSPLSLSGPAAEAVELLDRLTDSWAGAIEFVEEDDAAIDAAIRLGQVARLRYAAPDRVPNSVRAAAAESLQYVADTPISAHGRVELLWYFREQSVSRVYHRYGNLGLRADESRDEPA